MYLQKIGKKLATTLLLILCLVLAVSTLSITGLAAENDGMNFVIRPVLSKELQDTSVGYFNITTDVNKVYDLQLEVVNNSSQEAVYEIEVTTASTTMYGEVNYENTEDRDQSLKHSLTDIAKIVEAVDDGRVKVPGNTSKIFTVRVTAPSEAYEGTILGGIRVKDITARLEREAKAAQAADEDSEEVGMKIYQEYQSIIAIKLQDTDTEVSPDFVLDNVDAGNFNYRAAVIADIRNTQPRLVKGAVFSATVSPKGSNNFLFKIEDKELDFAPNSMMKYTFVDDAGTGIKAGTYLFEGKITFEGKTWDFSQEFVIEQQEAVEINETSLNQQQQGMTSSGMPMWLLVLILLVLILVIVLLIVLLISLAKKKKDDNSSEF